MVISRSQKEKVCRCCGAPYDADDIRFRFCTASRTHLDEWRKQSRGAIAKACGLEICPTCAGHLCGALAKAGAEPSHDFGTSWVVGKLKGEVKRATDPLKRQRDAEYKRDARGRAASRLFALECEMEELIWQNCPFDLEGLPYSDEMEDATGWEEIHEDIMDICRRWHLSSRYNDLFWHPEETWEAYRAECQMPLDIVTEPE